jgi:2-polyprenyl-6-methoxyphenol hydroxylase-like FAD-dependent oxidoreductase
MAGVETVLVEKDRHPRFHIGESLLPHSMSILEELGVLDRVDKIGVFKGGAEFVNHDGTHDAVFKFSRALLPGPSHAYQVRRSEFDHLLFERAGECGAVTLEETEAKILSFEEDAAVVRTVSADGEETDWQTRFLVDASGKCWSRSGQIRGIRLQQSSGTFAACHAMRASAAVTSAST